MTGYLTADEAAHLYQRTPGAIRELARRHHWPRITQAGRTHYSAQHIAATIERNRARPNPHHHALVAHLDGM